VSGISDLTERQAALKKLEKETTAAKRSVDKLQTPGVSRGARDRLRKAEQAGAVKPMEREGLEHLSPEEVTQKAAKGVTSDEANMIEMIDLAREAEAAGPTVKTVFDKIYAKSGGNDAAALPTLRALMEQVRKAKRPAAD